MASSPQESHDDGRAGCLQYRPPDGACVPFSLVEEYKESRACRGAKGQKAAQESADAAGDAAGEQARHPQAKNSKQRDLDLLFEAQEREKRAAQLRNARLVSLIQLRQHGGIRQEARAQEEIRWLKAELDRVVCSSAESTAAALAEVAGRGWSAPPPPPPSQQRLVEDRDRGTPACPDEGGSGAGPAVIAGMRRVNAAIQEGISKLHANIERQSECDKMNLVRHYRVRMHELAKDLAAEQRANYLGAQEWIDRNDHLHDEFGVATSTLAAVTDGNVALKTENRRLRVQHKEQEQERSQLVRNVATQKLEHARLLRQVSALEQEALGLTARRSDEAASQPLVGTRAAVRLITDGREKTGVQEVPPLNASEEARYVALIAKQKALLERERRELVMLRGRHNAVLQERTETEVFLRQCVNDVRGEISQATGRGCAVSPDDPSSSAGVSSFTSAGRGELLELLFSKERVLSLLHAKAFPFKPPPPSVSSTTDLHTHTRSGTPLAQSAQLDLAQLWQKWQDWAGPSRAQGHASSMPQVEQPCRRILPPLQ